MKAFLKKINNWIDRQFQDLKDTENNSASFKIKVVETTPTKADWANFYKNTPIKPSDLINK